MTDTLEQEIADRGNEIEKLEAQLQAVLTHVIELRADNARLRAGYREIMNLRDNKIVSGAGLFMRVLLIARRALRNTAP